MLNDYLDKIAEYIPLDDAQREFLRQQLAAYALDVVMDSKVRTEAEETLSPGWSEALMAVWGKL